VGDQNLGGNPPANLRGDRKKMLPSIKPRPQWKSKEETKGKIGGKRRDLDPPQGKKQGNRQKAKGGRTPPRFSCAVGKWRHSKKKGGRKNQQQGKGFNNAPRTKRFPEGIRGQKNRGGKAGKKTRKEKEGGGGERRQRACSVSYSLKVADVYREGREGKTEGGRKGSWEKREGGKHEKKKTPFPNISFLTKRVPRGGKNAKETLN